MISAEQFRHVGELVDSGRFAEAIRDSGALMSHADADEKAALLIGIYNSYLGLGRLDMARSVLDHALSLDLKHLGIRMDLDFLLPCLMAEEGRWAEAAAAFATLLDRYHDALARPEYRYLYEGIQVRRARALVSTGQFASAIPVAREALSFDAVRPAEMQGLRFDLGVSLQATGNKEAAAEELRRVVAFELGDELEVRALWRLANFDFERGALAQAKEKLEIILRNYPEPNPEVSRRDIYEGLANVFRLLGDRAQEMEYAALASKALRPDKRVPR